MIFEDVYHCRSLKRNGRAVCEKSWAQGSIATYEICVSVCQTKGLQTYWHVDATAARLASYIDAGE